MIFPDPILTKEFKYLSQKNGFRKYDRGCSSRIRIPDPDPDFLSISDSGSSGQKGTGSRIRFLNTGLYPGYCAQ